MSRSCCRSRARSDGARQPARRAGWRGQSKAHVHPDDDEAFYILAGELAFSVAGSEPFRATAGMFVHIPGGAAHGFRVESDTARYLVITTPQHERFYRAIGQPAASRSLPPRAPLDLDQVAAACQEHGVKFIGDSA